MYCTRYVCLKEILRSAQDDSTYFLNTSYCIWGEQARGQGCRPQGLLSGPGISLSMPGPRVIAVMKLA
jgi:hypothetical protein